MESQFKFNGEQFDAYKMIFRVDINVEHSQLTHTYEWVFF